MKRWILLVCLLLPALGAAAEGPKEAFPRFCEEWMEKLAAREKRNVSLIKWEQQSGSVAGSYVGYSSQHTCVFKEDSGPVPVGKITYLEVRFEKRGQTREEAEQSTPKPIETTEVTEIFRYDKGHWIY